MNFRWLKRSLPRGLFGRAALILLVPIVLLQLTISAAFIQRHFEDVTAQLTRGVILELALLVDATEREGLEAATAIARALRIGWFLPGTPPEADTRVFYDVSGLTVIETLRADLPEAVAVDLAGSSRVVRLAVETERGVVEATVSRRRFSASNPHQFLVLMVAIGLLMYGLGFVYLRNQLRPVTRLAAAAEAFGKGQTVAYAPSGATEVRAAGRAFLDMRDKIEQQMAQRTLLLSGVSHDLRTPLTRIKLDLSLHPESQGLESIAQDVDEMSGLIDGFLDFARGSSQEDFTDTVPGEIARSVVEKARRQGGRVALMEVDDAAEAPHSLRKASVVRALGNLVGNAMRYAQCCEVSVHVSGDEIWFDVHDDGPGIAEERREEAAQPFTRLDAARNQDRGSGVGLGLSIAGDVARAHGGQLLLLDSQRLGGLHARLVLARFETPNAATQFSEPDTAAD